MFEARQILSAFLRAAGDCVTRIRFDIAIRNAIRDQQQGGRRMMSMGTDLFAQQPASKQPARAPKRGMLFLLRPVKLLARYIRRFLVGQTEANIEALRLNIEALRLELIQSRLELIQSRTPLTQLMHVMHAQVEDIALRSRGVLAVDDATFALRTYDGFVFVPRQDTMLLLMALDAGPQGLEPGTRRVLTKVLAPGMTFIDIGANVGLLTLAGARAVGPSGKVLAFEPVPLSFDLLSRALAINGLIHRVEAKRQAVGARRERCKFFVRNVLGHSSLFRSDALSSAVTMEIEVDVSPLDELVQPRTRVDLVKIDVEGAELAVLEGMTRVIADNPELAIIAEFGPSHLKANDIAPETWFSAFRERGFDAFVIDELSAECWPAGPLSLADVESVNILFVRRNSSVCARVSR
jgi:FkbM family methyltransferase